MKVIRRCRTDPTTVSPVFAVAQVGDGMPRAQGLDTLKFGVVQMERSVFRWTTKDGTITNFFCGCVERKRIWFHLVHTVPQGCGL